MGTFIREGNRIIWQMAGERLMIEPWELIV
jgi:hypothetical protein